MNISRAIKLAQILLFTIPWTAPGVLVILQPELTSAQAFTTVSLAWAIISPLVLAGTSIVAYRCGIIKSSFTKQSER